MARAIFWESKDPNDVEDFAVDWTNQLNGESITAASWSIVHAAGVVIEASQIASPLAKVRLSGGNLNETAFLMCRVTTSSGRQLNQTVKLGLVTS